MRPFLLLAVLACAARPLAAQAPTAKPAPVRAEVQQLVRKYTDATNASDVTAAMEMFSRADGVTSVDGGEITRGWDAIRAQATELAGLGGSYTMTLGTIEVTPLGGGSALAVVPFTVTVAAPSGPAQLRGAMTLVLEKAGGAWKIVHEHYSLGAGER